VEKDDRRNRPDHVARGELSMFWRRLRSRERDLERELRSDLELEAAERQESGLPADEACYAARRAFGNTTSVEEQVRAMWGWTWCERLIEDLRYAVRTLRKSPVFTAVAVLSLALGIGANSAIFTLIDVVMLRSLPVAEPGKLVEIEKFYDNQKGGFSYPLYQELRDRNQVFRGLLTASKTPLRLSDEPEGAGAQGQYVSGNFFQVLGVRAWLGRTIVPEDDRLSHGGGNPVAVIGYGLWQRRFGGDPAAVGKTLSVEGRPFTVVGVLPQGFYGLQVGQTLDFAIPIAREAQIRPQSWLGQSDYGWLSVVGRLQPGVSRTRARADLAVVFHQFLLAHAGGGSDPHERELALSQRLEVSPAANGLSAPRDAFSHPLLILMAAVALVLLIACANLANLLLDRASARRREMAVRLAIGAGRGRLIRQLLTESLLLSTLGGLLGLFLAWWGSAFLVSMMANGGTPLRLDLDARVLAFTFSVSVLTSVLFGVAPALRSTRVDVGPALKEGGRAVGRDPSRAWLGKALLMAQVALSLMLLAGAGLFMGTLRNLRTMDAGFERAGILLSTIEPGAAGYHGPALANFYRALLLRVGQLPGVRACGLSLITPIAGGGVDLPAQVEGYTAAPHEDNTVYVNRVSPGYFAAFGTPLLAGRDFDWHDRPESLPVALINESMARYYFHNASPLGRWVVLGGGGPARIVGVVKDARYMSLREPIHRTVYMDEFQLAEMDQGLGFEVRTTTNPLQLLAPIRSEVHKIGGNVPVKNETTFDRQIDQSLMQERLMATLSGFFGALALLLAAIGTYGVLAYAVGRRTNEIGIRMALGASGGSVLWMILRETVTLVLGGIAVGLPLTLAVTRLTGKLLFGLTPADPLTLALAMFAMAVTAAAASYLPARRAARVDPMVALRYE
jgi:predicted permease